MRIFSISNCTPKQQKSFKGETKYLNSTYSYGGDVRVENYKRQSNISAYSDYTNVVKNRPYATVEKTLNTFHSGVTQAVYYANPDEEISPRLKECVDYIVYDNKPPYPVADGYISENYFGRLRHNFVKDFDEVRNYYYRLEIADAKNADEFRRRILANVDVDKSKELFDYYNYKIEQAKENQRIAQTCIDIYNEAGDLRYKKERAEDNIEYLIREQNILKTKMQEKNIELKAAQAELKSKEKTSQLIDSKLSRYNDIDVINGLLEKDSTTYKPNLEEKNLITKYMIETQDNANKLNKIKKQLNDTINQCKKFLASAPRELKDLKNKQKAAEALVENLKAKLIPMYQKLQAHYNAKQLLHR